ncbi:glycosyltransferase involved in cell wall biosynthesis [Epilithonimonas hungarica]|uniref:glycosyltransferase n=1 Tax=Epilithonimonas hungarica TaxID=454006 RepID=UPI002782580B|nr:glycosyltransferase [Epilithonimonas hungarica]MDP9956819.1 glycosyltransferase involved in cell wall biosynthesis [Epilithonimonas hungarica]
MKISFVIPVYNVEKYVEKAILSVIKNDWGDHEYEIIIVDDESPDNSVEIIKNIVLQYPKSRIRIISQKNKGLGGARNTGLEYAGGDYVFFLDSDDYILKDIFPEFMNIVVKMDLDVLEFGACRVSENYQIIDYVFLNTTEDKVLSGEEYVININFANSVCNKLYKVNFLKQNKIVFFEKTYIEDAPFNIELFSKAKRILATEMVGAAYLQNTNSITRNKRSSSYLIKFISDSIFVTSRMFSLVENYNTIDAKKKIKQKVAFFISGIIRMIVFGKGLTIKQRIDFFKQLRRHDLFPFYQTTGSYVRTFFLTIANIFGAMRIL